MALPNPVPGLVIGYSYLWSREHARGQEEGLKDRPCAIILTSTPITGGPIVTVLPITHTPPPNSDLAIEIPRSTKQRLGLDDARSWVMLTEANRFIWPGPDLRPAQLGNAASIAYGQLPYTLFETIRLKFLTTLKTRAVTTIPRTE